MKKCLFSVIVVFIFWGCSHKNIYHNKIYDKIYNCQGIDIELLNKRYKQPNYVKIQLDNVNKLIRWDYLDKLGYSKKNDTIYILELDGIRGNFLFTVWNKNDTLSYTNESGKLMQTERRLFIEYMMKLVGEWDVDEIRKEEKINKVSLPEEKIYATKITFDKGKYNINCISFYDFFNLKRDGTD